MTSSTCVVYSPSELHLLPHPIFLQAVEAEYLWRNELGAEIPFPGVVFATSDQTGCKSYWIDGGNLPAGLPPMFTRTGKRCLEDTTPRAGNLGYLYRAPALKTVLDRLRRGAPLFAN